MNLAQAYSSKKPTMPVAGNHEVRTDALRTILSGVYTSLIAALVPSFCLHVYRLAAFVPHMLHSAPNPRATLRSE